MKYVILTLVFLFTLTISYGQGLSRGIISLVEKIMDNNNTKPVQKKDNTETLLKTPEGREKIRKMIILFSENPTFAKKFTNKNIENFDGLLKEYNNDLGKTLKVIEWSFGKNVADEYKSIKNKKHKH
jgi:hypothetical protein